MREVGFPGGGWGRVESTQEMGKRNYGHGKNREKSFGHLTTAMRREQKKNHGRLPGGKVTARTLRPNGPWDGKPIGVRASLAGSPHK